MIASEALPYSKTGGLGDVLASLSLALSAENEVKLIIPCTQENLNGNLSAIQNLSDSNPNSSIKATLYKDLESTSFETFLIQEETLLTRKGVYGSDGVTYHDNCKRFALFSRLALSATMAMEWTPDIIHTHDWPTALIPAYLKCKPWADFFKKSKTIFSIHNLGYQGSFPLRSAHEIGLPAKWIPLSPTKENEINFMASALQHADKITTVSPTYATEILCELYSHDLASILKERKEDLSGIINGIDLEKWNPEIDPILPANYTKNNMKGKEKCKKALLKLHPFANPKLPLIAMITRLAVQKGINETFGDDGAMQRICAQLPVNVIVIGTGEGWCEEKLLSLTEKFPNFIGLNIFDEKLSHLVEAAADFFLMPSAYEPCGLNQMYSSTYGTLPIVRATGGLADTVIAQHGNTEDATGYHFNDLTPSAIFDTVKWALSIYNNQPQLHQKMVLNGMNQDFSWKHSATEYLNLYKSL